MSTARLQRLVLAMQKSGLDALVLNPGPTLTYLTGLHMGLMERPTTLIITPSADPVLILPELEMQQLKLATVPIQPFAFNDNPTTWGGVFAQAAGALKLETPVIGLEPTRLRFLEIELLKSAIPACRLVSGAGEVGSLRMQKDAAELDTMRQAVRCAQQALQATIPFIKVGVTERQIAQELFSQVLRAGSEPSAGFMPIVSGGPNSANPHATPSDRALRKGDLLVIDWGAAIDGYNADLTRSFAIGEVDPELTRIANIVMEANAAGRAAGKPGLRAGEVDIAARDVIAHAGYGKFFTHRTGHGLGMEVHEPPYMFEENDLILQPGMTFTVEPGIYLPEIGGVRIEDDVVITATGAESLSDLPRGLHTIG